MLVAGRYRVDSSVGSGASSLVFAVRDEGDGHDRVLKVLRREADLPLLQSEFAHLAQLDHPNLARAYALGRLDAGLVGHDQAGVPYALPAGAPFLILERVAGVPARVHLESLPEERRAEAFHRIAFGLARALEQLHGVGLVHRDIKPENLIADAHGEAVLVDFGLSSQPRQAADLVIGTLAYMAPEALLGHYDARTDLYALGATLYELACGAPPFTGRGAELVKRILAARPDGHQPRLACAWLPDATRDLVARLLSLDVLRRPPSARAVSAELARIRGEHEVAIEIEARPEILPPAFVGRCEALAELVELLEGNGAGRAVLLVGEAGAGKSRLLQEASRRLQLRALAGEASPLRVITCDVYTLARLAAATEPTSARGSSSTPSLSSLAERVADRIVEEARYGSVLHFERVGAADLLALAVLREVSARLAGGDDPPYRILLEADAPDAPERLGLTPRLRWAHVDLSPFELDDLDALVRSMTGRDLSRVRLEQLRRASAGLPALAVDLLRSGYATNADEAPMPSSGGAQLLSSLVRARRSRADDEERSLLDALAVCGGRAAIHVLSGLLKWPARRILRRALPLITSGTLERDGELLRTPSRAYAAAWCEVIPALRRQSLHQRAALAQDALPERVEHLLAAAALGAGSALRWTPVVRAARQLSARHHVARAVALLELALRVVSEQGAGRPAAERLLSELYIQCGRYSDALARLAEPHVGLELLRAEALQRRGDYADAERLLGHLVETGRPSTTAQARVLLGRLYLRGGRLTEALQVCDPGAATPEVRQGVLEVAGLAHFYSGRLAEADALFAAGRAALREGDDLAQRARFASLRGMVAFRQGHLASASSLYREAVEGARRAGDPHALAIYLGNLGSTELERGFYAEALSQLSQSAAALERLGQSAELAMALCNYGSLLLLLGDLEGAEAAREHATIAAHRAGAALASGYGELLGGDLLRRRGQPAEALAWYAKALGRFQELGASWEVTLCHLLDAEARAEAGQVAPAASTLDELAASAEDPNDELRAGRIALTLARLRAHGQGDWSVKSSLGELVARIARYCALLEQRGAASDLWRAAVVLGILLEAAGERERARAVFDKAREVWEQVMSNAPESYRESLRHDPDARTLLRRWEALGALDGAANLESASSKLSAPVASAAPRGSDREHQRVRRLLAINKRLNSELRLAPLLEMVMDAAIELTDAERGFLILTGRGVSFEIKVARNIAHRDLEGEDLALSRSIAQRAAERGEAVVTVDAADDERFRGALSVSGLHLRSVLAVPLRVKDAVVGTLYVDHRLRRGVFSDDDAVLLQDLADQAAIAIENARLVEENERRREQIERLNQQLSAEVATQAAELEQAREQLRSGCRAPALHHDYTGIIGQSPRMQQLFHLVDRVTDTDLPVVIQGESGTGKELVARAIHFNGARGRMPFVGENCGAIPETLLESVLFGSARGAFTGADRDRKGLFEIAHGGTLFLDEIGEMSAAMQTKLLRVLQDGEFRRVGEEKTRRADVRVIAASNRDLEHLVRAGVFREDLFYRLNVIRIEVPALRARAGDLAALVQHFLQKHAPGREVRFSRAAMARLCDHGWPGNVRELENEIMRLAALAGDIILPEDLSPTIGTGAVDPPLEEDENDLTLRPRVERLERALIHRALTCSRGNQSQAARALGLSRFGLLKKLKRYFPEQYAS